MSGEVYTADQLYGALAALGAAPLLEPGQRPAGPTADDRPQLLGILLAAVEMGLLAEPSDSADEVNRGYVRQARLWGDDGAVCAAMLATRFAFLHLMVAANGVVGDEGGALLTAITAVAESEALLLGIWHQVAIGPAGDPEEQAIRQMLTGACQSLRTGRQAFEDLRRALIKQGHQL